MRDGERGREREQGEIESEGWGEGEREQGEIESEGWGEGEGERAGRDRE